VHCRVTPRGRPSIRFLFVESEVWAAAPFRFHLAMDTLALGYKIPAITALSGLKALSLRTC
ncbi:MAG: hypothetical protein KDD28_17900, partial [Phaeodactylibacter sp.]|nr:hypothetical protein [Phaeodactylibacter sp.]